MSNYIVPRPLRWMKSGLNELTVKFQGLVPEDRGRPNPSDVGPAVVRLYCRYHVKSERNGELS